MSDAKPTTQVCLGVKLAQSSPQSMILPTNGRIVYYYRRGYSMSRGAQQPEPAMIVYVLSERMVNLTVFNRLGTPRSVQGVKLVQPVDEQPSNGEDYCTWMPYQVGQAAKNEELERRLRQDAGGAPQSPHIA